MASGLAKGSKSANKLNHCELSFDFEFPANFFDPTAPFVCAVCDSVLDSSSFCCNKSISFWTVEGLAGLAYGNPVKSSWPEKFLKNEIFVCQWQINIFSWNCTLPA